MMKTRIQNSPALMAVFERISRERLRQRALMRAGKISFACESPIVGDDRKLRVLVEEVGEVAQALDHLERATARGRVFAREDLQTELVQVAAVACAWLEALENEK